MSREFNVQTSAGRPQIAFRETITSSARAEGEYKRQSGGKGQYGDVIVVLEPNAGRGNEIINEIVGGVIPKEYIRPTVQGIEDALREGVLNRSPVTDVRCRIVDGSFHPVDSSEIAFRTAGRIAFKNAMKDAAPVLLEPIMSVEVTTPVEDQGDILGDISRRRGTIQNVTTDGLLCVVEAEVPLENLFGYAMDLRSLSKGRADYSMTPCRYAMLPSQAVASAQLS
jgi:elongation factor G